MGKLRPRVGRDWPKVAGGWGARTAERGVGCSRAWRRRVAVASGALSRLCCPSRQGTGLLPRFTSKNKHVPQAAPVPRRAAPRPPAPPPPRPGQSRLCARPATPAAQAILISVWVCAGRWESKPAFFQRPDPTPASCPPGPPGSAYPCWQPREVEPSWSHRLEFESHLLQRRDLGHAADAQSLGFLILFPNNSTRMSQLALKMSLGGLMRSNFS